MQPAVGAALDRPHRATARDDALGQHLPAEDPPVRLLLALAAEQGDVLGEGLGQRHRRLTGRAGGRRHRLHAHLRRPQLLEVEGGEEVEQGRRLVGGHRGNDSQRASRCVPNVGEDRRPIRRSSPTFAVGPPGSGHEGPPAARRARRRAVDCADTAGPHGRRRRGPGGRRPRSSPRARARRAGAPSAPARRPPRSADPRRRAAPRPRQPPRRRSRRRPRAARTTGRARRAAPGSAARAGGRPARATRASREARRSSRRSRGQPRGDPHQLEQHQLLEHRRPEVAGHPRLDEPGERGAGGPHPAGAQAAPVRLRRAADGDRARVVRGERAAASGRRRGRPRRSSRR